MKKAASIEELLTGICETSLVQELQNLNLEITDLLTRQENFGKISTGNLKRLEFIKELLGKGLSITAVRHYVGLYSCWLRGFCPAYMHRYEQVSCAKRCWKETGAYCRGSFEESNPCAICQRRDLECPAEEPMLSFAGLGMEDNDPEYL
ncbi:hypothetical protein ACFLUE_02900 [Chloroflexota bacterium]